MSRIGKKPITIPKGVTASIADGHIRVKGPKGELSSPIPEGISVSLEEAVLEFTRSSELGKDRAAHGLARAPANNIIVGVTQGFTKQTTVAKSRENMSFNITERLHEASRCR